jgi:hypothetical protein
MSEVISWIDTVPEELISIMNHTLQISTKLMLRRISYSCTPLHSPKPAESTFPEFGQCFVEQENPTENSAVCRGAFSLKNNKTICSDLAKILCIHLEQLQALFANEDQKIPLTSLDIMYHLIYDILHISHQREKRIYRIFNGITGKAVLISSSIIRRFDSSGCIDKVN